MITSYLIRLGKLVSDVTGKELGRQDAEVLTMTAFAQELVLLEQGLQQVLDELVTSKQREALIKRKMCHLQLRCALFLDLLLAEGKSLQSLTTKALALEEMLLRLLTYQYSHFGNYFNHNLKAPKAYVDACFLTLDRDYLLLAAGLKKKKVPEALSEILLGVFAPADKAPFYAYQQLIYLEQLQVALINFCRQVSNVPFEDALLAYLIYLNFNHGPFINYVRLMIDKELSSLLGTKAQFELWCAKEHYFSCLTTKNAHAYDEAQDSAKSQILRYITCGIVYHQRNAAMQVGLYTPAHSLPIDHYRVKLNISADALAYLIRLFIETGLVDATPRSQLLLFVSKHFQTTGVGDELLSVNSLGTKYKQVVQRTALHIRTLLKRMTKTIETNFDC